MDPFEDVRREYVNRYRETHGILLANDYDSFVNKMLDAIQITMNESDVGQEIIDEALGVALARNLTPEQWSLQKANLMIVLFCMALDACPFLKHEMAHHLYNELRKEAND